MRRCEADLVVPGSRRASGGGGAESSGDPSVARSCVLPPLGAQWTWGVDVGVSGSYATVVAVYFNHLR